MLLLYIPITTDSVFSAMEAAQLARNIALAAPASEYSLMKQEEDHYERMVKIGQGTFG